MKKYKVVVEQVTVDRIGVSLECDRQRIISEVLKPGQTKKDMISLLKLWQKDLVIPELFDLQKLIDQAITQWQEINQEPKDFNYH